MKKIFVILLVLVMFVSCVPSMASATEFAPIFAEGDKTLSQEGWSAYNGVINQVVNPNGTLYVESDIGTYPSFMKIYGYHPDIPDINEFVYEIKFKPIGYEIESSINVGMEIYYSEPPPVQSTLPFIFFKTLANNSVEIKTQCPWIEDKYFYIPKADFLADYHVFGIEGGNGNISFYYDDSPLLENARFDFLPGKIEHLYIAVENGMRGYIDYVRFYSSPFLDVSDTSFVIAGDTDVEVMVGCANMPGDYTLEYSAKYIPGVGSLSEEHGIRYFDSFDVDTGHWVLVADEYQFLDGKIEIIGIDWLSGLKTNDAFKNITATVVAKAQTDELRLYLTDTTGATVYILIFKAGTIKNFTGAVVGIYTHDLTAYHKYKLDLNSATGYLEVYVDDTFVASTTCRWNDITRWGVDMNFLVSGAMSTSLWIDWIDVVSDSPNVEISLIPSSLSFTSPGETQMFILRFDMKQFGGGDRIITDIYMLDSAGRTVALIKGEEPEEEEAPVSVPSWYWIAGGAGIAVIAIVAVAYISSKKQCDDEDYAKGHPKICKKVK